MRKGGEWASTLLVSPPLLLQVCSPAHRLSVPDEEGSVG